jgi:small subunit ribosomal protein S4
LDNVVFIAGFSHSRSHARQLITHGHFRVNDHKATAPSLMVEKGDIVSFREKAKKHDEYKAIVDFHKSKSVPGWLDPNRDNMELTVLSFPTREDVGIPVEEHLIVELYSK